MSIERRIVQGTAAMVTHLVELSQGRGGINTAYIERLNATFRQRLASLARRTRALVRQPETLHLGMYVSGRFSVALELKSPGEMIGLATLAVAALQEEG